jgi:MoaA/NifB/PqqE/SkfB family radical SAM enzyme
VKTHFPEVTARDFHINTVANSEHFYGSTRATLGQNTAKAVKQFKQAYGYSLNLFDLHEQYYMSKILDYIKDGRYPLRTCFANRSSIFLDPQGNLYPCVAYSKELGNIKKLNFRLANLKAQHTSILKECPHCWNACDGYPSIFSAVLYI